MGRFADVTPVDRRRTFWRTRSALLAADGTLLATAAIVFRAGADYSERQMAFFRSRTDPEIFERMFPNHRGRRFGLLHGFLPARGSAARPRGSSIPPPK